MQVVEVHKASDSVEAHFLCQVLEEEGVACQIVGEHIESLFGLMTTWNRPSILVSEEDEGRAREILAAWLQPPAEDPPPSPKLQFGMRWLLLNFTLIAVVFASYGPLGPAWPAFALNAFLLLLLSNALAFVYVHLRRRRIAEHADEQ